MNRFTQYRLFLAIAMMLSAASPTKAAVIGVETFDYPDGPVAGQSGGDGWDWNNVAKVHTGTVSDWDVAFGAPQVTGGVLVTNNSGALRQYNGPTTGGAANPDTDERLGALRAEGRVYYSAEMTRLATDPGSPWGGMSGYDFGTERLFFGIPGGANQGTNRYFGIGSAVSAYSNLSAVDGETYHLVAELDFDKDRVRLWVDPEINGFANPVVSAPYTGTNWSTAVRLASGPTQTEWDNLQVTTTYGQVFNQGLYFYENFADPNGTPMDGKVAPVGIWDQTSGNAMTVQDGATDTQGGARRLLGLFDQPLSGGNLVLDFETAETAGSFHSNGWAGISLFEGGNELVFLGDLGGASSTWGLNVDGDTFTTGVSGEAQAGRFTYNYGSGDWEFFLDGNLQLSGTAQPGLAFDRLRIGNDSGGDMAVSHLSIVPEPSTALLSVALLLAGLLLRRRKR